MKNLATQWRQQSEAVKIAQAELVMLPSGAQVKLCHVAPEMAICVMIPYPKEFSIKCVTWGAMHLLSWLK